MGNGWFAHSARIADQGAYQRRNLAGAGSRGKPTNLRMLRATGCSNAV